MKTSNEPVWRSLLYVPAHVPRFVAKAAGCDADALILDLEDSVPPEWKAPARDGLADTVAGLAAVGHEVLVRANGPLEPLVADLRAALAAGVHGIVLPKVRGASHIEAIDELLDALEAEHGIAAGRTRIVAIIETPGAFQAMERIARASPRIAAMMLGGGDFALHCGAEARADVLRVPKQLLVIAARAARVQPLGLVGGLDEIRDLDTFERLARESADLGYAGATCIHPAQVEALNRAFRPSDAAVRAAREIVAAYDDARANGRGALRVGDRMVDAPGVAHARNVLARAAIRDRDARAGARAPRATAPRRCSGAIALPLACRGAASVRTRGTPAIAAPSAAPNPACAAKAPNPNSRAGGNSGNGCNGNTHSGSKHDEERFQRKAGT